MFAFPIFVLCCMAHALQTHTDGTQTVEEIKNDFGITDIKDIAI